MPGPGDDLNRIRVPELKERGLSPSGLETLNTRQKRMATLLTEGQELTSRKCENLFNVTRDTTTRDFEILINAGIAKKVGKGRSTIYVYQENK